MAEWRRLQLTQGVVSDMAIDEELSQVEYWRRRDHHDVLCLVLKERLRLSDPHPGDDERCVVESARRIADLAYPPPKEQA
jgi:hypothetical protein